MAGILVESFGWLATTTDLALRGWVASTAGKWSADATGGPEGQPVMKVTDADGSSIVRRLSRAASGTILRMAFRVKTSVGYSGDASPNFPTEVLFGVFNSSTNANLCLGMEIDGSINVNKMTSSGTSLDTIAESTTLINDGEWHRIELEMFANDTGTAKLWIDGNLEVDFSGDTRVGTAEISTFTHVICGPTDVSSPPEEIISFSDLIIWDDSGTEFTGEFGQDILPRIKYIQPDSAGTTTDFTPSTGSNFENVDEAGIDGDITYNESSVSTDRDIFNYGALGVSLDEIFTVSSTSIVRNTDVGSIDARNVNKSSSTVTVGPTYGVNSTDYGDKVLEQILDNDPDTSAQWTESGVDAAEFGYENV